MYALPHLEGIIQTTYRSIHIIGTHKMKVNPQWTSLLPCFTYNMFWTIRKDKFFFLQDQNTKLLQILQKGGDNALINEYQELTANYSALQLEHTNLQQKYLIAQMTVEALQSQNDRLGERVKKLEDEQAKMKERLAKIDVREAMRKLERWLICKTMGKEEAIKKGVYSLGHLPAVHKEAINNMLTESKREWIQRLKKTGDTATHEGLDTTVTKEEFLRAVLQHSDKQEDIADKTAIVDLLFDFYSNSSIAFGKDPLA